MKRQAYILITVVALIAAVVLPARPALAIIGGEFDGNAHPYVGALDLRPIFGPGDPIPCTGTLISPTVFLTAGHCTAFFDQAGLTEARVTFDPDMLSANARFYTGSVHTNPLFTHSQDDPGDLGVIVFSKPVKRITPASLPTAGLLDQLGPQGLRTVVFTMVGYGVTRLLGGSSGGGPPGVDPFSAGTRMVATMTFLSLTDAWLSVSMLDDGRGCIGDSGAPLLPGDTDLVVAVGVRGDGACEATGRALRLDTPTARAFLGQFVESAP